MTKADFVAALVVAALSIALVGGLERVLTPTAATHATADVHGEPLP
jgi:hypothetical protein